MMIIMIYEIFLWPQDFIIFIISRQEMRNWPILCHTGFPGGANCKESTCRCRRCKRRGFYSRVRKIPWRRKWQPNPVFLPKICHRQRSLVGYSPWGYKELDMIEWLSTMPHIHATNSYKHNTEQDLMAPLMFLWASLVAQLVKNLPAMQETLVQFLACEVPLEKG